MNPAWLPSSITAAMGVVQAHWVSRAATGTMRYSSTARYARVSMSFARFSSATGIESVEELTPAASLRFMHAPLPGHGPPSASTARFRLTVIRAAIRHLIEIGEMQTDPTVGLRVQQPASRLRPRPLTPHEVLRLRTVPRLRPKDTLRPATVELALSGMSHAEVARSVAVDFGRADRTLAIHGPTARTIQLSEPAARLLERRVDALRRGAAGSRRPYDPCRAALALHRPLDTYPRESIAPTVSTNLSRALDVAGLYASGIRPRSLREFAANVAYAQHGRAEDVAVTLGLVSLDVALSLVDGAWQNEWGEAFRDAR